MQELYDQKVLHSILGVEPLPTVVEHVQSDEEIRQSPSSKRQASKVIEDAWEQTRRSRDYAYHESSHSRQHRHRVADDHEEGGRYDIGRHKRRKTGRAIDNHHNVIFVDDDEEHRGYDDDDDDPGEGECEERYESYVDRYREPYPENPKNDRRRLYWLSKGIGPGSVDEEDISY